MGKRLLTSLCVGTLFFVIGCGKSTRTPANSEQSSMPASGGTPAERTMMPMMKEDPRSIKSVEGVLQEVNANQIVVFTKKNVALKFQQDAKTSVMPNGEKLAAGMNVKIEIEHLSRGMRAKTIEVESQSQSQ